MRGWGDGVLDSFREDWRREKNPSEAAEEEACEKARDRGGVVGLVGWSFFKVIVVVE